MILLARHTARTASIVTLAAACVLALNSTATAQRRQPEIQVEPFDAQTSIDSYVLLEEQLLRFAARYGTRIALATDQMRASASTSSEELLFLRWRNVSNASMLDIATGRNTISNLLDMIVMTTLTRLVLESYWAPEVFGIEESAPLLEAYRVLENEIWQIGAQVLDQEQQGSLRSIINDWHRDNPDQTYPWYIRLDEFSGQRAADIQRVEQTGGLLGIKAATQTVDEVRLLAERIMFYLEHAPTLTTQAFEETVFEFFETPQIKTTAGDVSRFVDVSGELVDVARALPDEQFAVLDQFSELLSTQREELFAALEGTGTQAEATLSEARGALEALERIMLLSGAGKEKDPERRFDIQDYVTMAAEASDAAQELRLVMDGAERLAGSTVWSDRDSGINVLVDRLQETQREFLIGVTLMAIVVIAFFFLALIGYRVAMLHIAGSRSAPS
ncbi:MAG: hypothetical protein ACWGPN_13990 [Gammaproteobacteria bacterium]